MILKCHADDSTEGGYGMILVIYLFTLLGLDLFSDIVMIDCAGLYEGLLATMIGVNKYDF